MKTRTVVKAETNTADHTCCVPWSAASRAVIPFSRWRKIFSSTTIAASTTIPTANAIPAKEITLIDLPIAAIATKEATTETGIAIDTIRVALNERRKQRRMSTANEPPTYIFC